MSIKQDTNKNDNIDHLSQMGWTSHFQTQWEQFSNDGFIPARVVGVRKNSFRTSNGKNEWLATLAGRLKHDAGGDIELIDVEGSTVMVALRGMCTTCAASEATLKDFVQTILRENVTSDLEVEEVKE